MSLIYLDFLRIIHAEFPDLIKDAKLFFNKLRIQLINDTWIEIRYPVLGKFSFHWQDGDKLYRFDTAPHHPQVASFPRHIHFESEDNVIEDAILSEDGTPEDHLREFLTWVQQSLT